MPGEGKGVSGSGGLRKFQIPDYKPHVGKPAERVTRIIEDLRTSIQAAKAETVVTSEAHKKRFEASMAQFKRGEPITEHAKRSGVVPAHKPKFNIRESIGQFEAGAQAEQAYSRAKKPIAERSVFNYLCSEDPPHAMIGSGVTHIRGIPVEQAIDEHRHPKKTDADYERKGEMASPSEKEAKKVTSDAKGPTLWDEWEKQID
ncbi:MAG: hypothetical protein K940chlam8_01006, partial [Chlamydiae bacterium]|nr:hypothetical protein [Chlamydiota bacterium]